jgi:hypothetical protein
LKNVAQDLKTPADSTVCLLEMTMLEVYLYGCLFSLIAVPILRAINHRIGEPTNVKPDDFYWIGVFCWWLFIPSILIVIAFRGIYWSVQYTIYPIKYWFKYRNTSRNEFAQRYTKITAFIADKSFFHKRLLSGLPLVSETQLEKIVDGQDLKKIRWFIGRWEDAMPRIDEMIHSEKILKEQKARVEAEELNKKQRVAEEFRKLASGQD